MNKYLVSYYSDFTGEIEQGVLTATNEREAIIAFLYSIGEVEGAKILEDVRVSSTLEDIRTQIAQWDAAIAIMPLIMKL